MISRGVVTSHRDVTSRGVWHLKGGVTSEECDIPRGVNLRGVILRGVILRDVTLRGVTLSF